MSGGTWTPKRRRSPSSSRTGHRPDSLQNVPSIYRSFLGWLPLICSAKFHPVACLVEHGVQVINAPCVVGSTAPPSVQKRIFLPPSGSICIAYSEVPGGVSSLHELFLERVGSVAMGFLSGGR